MYGDRKRRKRITQAKESWERDCLKPVLEQAGESKKKFSTPSGVPIKRVYTPLDLDEKGWDYLEKLGFPGAYPYTRGITPTMYRTSLWRVAVYGGFGTAEETNKRFKYILEQGGLELFTALDLPTQVGYDSDNPLAQGEVGRVGVPIDSLVDIETLFDGIPLSEDIAVGTTAMALGPIFLALMIALAEKRGVPPKNLTFFMSNDPLKEYPARGLYIFPPRPALRLTGDAIEYSIKNEFNSFQPIFYEGYHMAEAGANAIQEMAFTLAMAVEYIKEVISRGVSADELPQPRVGLVGNLDFFENICKHRAFRRMFARIMKERFNAKNLRSISPVYWGSGQPSLYTAQQPLNNIVRGTIIVMGQALAGCQFSAVSPFTETLSLPTLESERVAIRTPQIVAYESGIMNTVDPLAGSYYVETLTDDLEERAMKLFEEIEAMGGFIAAIEQGFIESEITKSAYQLLKQTQSGEKIIVGLNKYQVDEPITIELMKVDPATAERQIEQLKKLREERDTGNVESALKQLKEAAKEKGTNLVAPILAAVKTYATIEEICDALRDVFGEYRKWPAPRK